ncbi:MarR family transcriptional regulator [Dyella sp.]|uniref:MarR family transcriptional regulator n=1 Tax=Dyella sp. TaxID=1869338 RepID=UPI002B45E004|nr:MarR family transcriptional regulator [Dyella sp.]HKT27978.1 MarR family transcriptional regulator [Dyella sp.]
MELKPQDLLVLLKVAAHPGQRWTYAALGEALTLSASEVHACVRRAVAAGLVVTRGRGDWAPVRPALIEFAVHGVRYVWPAQLGPVKRGVPTSFGVEPLAAKISAGGDEAPVWAHPAGKAKGPSLSPLYHSAPQAALVDPALHRLLALQDAIRAGRARERSLATDLLTKELENMDAAG